MAAPQEGLFSNLDRNLDKALDKIDKIDDKTADLIEKFQKLPSDIKEAAEALEKFRIIPSKYDVAGKYRELAEELKRLAVTYGDLYGEGASFEKILKSNRAEIRGGMDDVDDFSKSLMSMRREIDKEAQSSDRAAKATEKAGKKRSETARKSKKEIELEKKTVDSLVKSLENVTKEVETIRAALKTGAGLKVEINNAGFKRVLDEMANAIDRFHERAEGATPRKKNFFDQMLGTREENKKSGDDLVKVAKQTSKDVATEFLKPLGDELRKSVGQSISRGIKDGVSHGISSLKTFNPEVEGISGLVKGLDLSQKAKKRFLTTMAGKVDETEVQVQIEKGNADFKARKYEADKKKETAIETARSKRLAELDFAYNKDPEAWKKKTAISVESEEIKLQKQRLSLQKMLNKEKEKETNRKWNREETLRVNKELLKVEGEEGTKIRKLGQEYARLQSKQRQIIRQGEYLNKINASELANNTERIKNTVRKWAEESWKVRRHVDETANRLKSMQTVYTRIASLTQTMSAGISAASGLWSNMRTAATSFFRYFTNGFRRAFSYVRQQASNMLKLGYEQREKIEQAQIGFASFFGEENVDAVTRRVRQEAAKTPIVDAGSLAEYVQQLAPVSKGNASLAINSALGILKGLVYSGSDISEGEYVIKNIRDVIAKGKATAIDIRQFNRALPGLEQALRESGQSAFLDKEGKLNLTPKNIGKVLELFANLNTDDNSPLKAIEEKQLRTLSGLEQLLTEKKTTAMENIMEKSGFFDLMYGVLGLGTDDKNWNKISNFLGNTLQPIVTKLKDIVTNTDWTKVGNAISEFFTPIVDAIKSAKEMIFTTLKDILGANDMAGVMKRLSNIIASFIKGFGEGVNEVIKFITSFIQKISRGDLEKFAEVVGKYLVSPLGKVIQMLLGFSQNAIGAISRISANISSLYKGLGDVWKWATDKGAASYANNLVANVPVTALNVGQMQDLMAGKKVSVDKSVLEKYAVANNIAAEEAKKMANSAGETAKKVAAAGVTVSKGDQIIIKAGNTMTWFKDKATLAAANLAKFAVKIGSALMTGGMIWTLGQVVGETVSSMRVFGDASDDIAKVIKSATEAIAFIVTGAMIGGVTGGLVGALAYSIKAIIDYSNAVQEERKKIHDEEENKILDAAQQRYADAAMEILAAQGVNTDTGSDIGNYAYQRMKKWLTETDLSLLDPSTIAAKAANEYAHAIKFKQTAEAIKNLSLSDEYQNAGGNVVDLSSNTYAGTRNKLAEKIKYYRLLGDSASYDTMSAESIVKQFLNGDKITDKQMQMYLDKFDEFDDTYEDSTTKLTETLEDSNTWSEKVRDAMNRLRESIDGFREDLIENDKKNGGYVSAYPETPLGTSSKQKLENWDKADDQWFGDNYSIDGMKVYHSDLYQAIVARANELARKKKEMEETGLKGTEEYEALTDELADVLIDMHQFTSGQYQEVGKIVEKMTSKYEWFSQKLREKVEEDYREVEKHFLWFSWTEKERFAQTGGMIKKRVRPVYRAGGGLGVDTVPAYLQPGEFVMRKSTVDRVGLSTMFALNRGDLVSAARNLGARFSQSYNNSRNWNSVVNNNQKTQSNVFKIFNRNKSGRVNTYYSLANRIALA